MLRCRHSHPTLITRPCKPTFLSCQITHNRASGKPIAMWLTGYPCFSRPISRRYTYWHLQSATSASKRRDRCSPKAKAAGMQARSNYTTRKEELPARSAGCACFRRCCLGRRSYKEVEYGSKKQGHTCWESHSHPGPLHSDAVSERTHPGTGGDRGRAASQGSGGQGRRDAAATIH